MPLRVAAKALPTSVVLDIFHRTGMVDHMKHMIFPVSLDVEAISSISDHSIDLCHALAFKSSSALVCVFRTLKAILQALTAN